MQLKPIWYWLSEAGTVLANGFIAGLPSGGLVGGGVGVAATATSSLDDINKVHYAAAGIALAAIGNAGKRFLVWHDVNPLPNPFPKPVDQPQTTPQSL